MPSEQAKSAVDAIAREARKWTSRCDDAKRIPDALYDFAPAIIDEVIATARAADADRAFVGAAAYLRKHAQVIVDHASNYDDKSLREYAKVRAVYYRDAADLLEKAQPKSEADNE